MTRRPDNFEGAFPLLLIGSVLVVYAGILASQEIGSRSAHLPLWGLLGGVGAVIVGAGIYSTFLEPGAPPTPEPMGESVTVPKAKAEGTGYGARSLLREPAGTEAAPIWWEGPPPSRGSPPTRETVTAREPPTGRGVPGAPRVPTRTGVPSRIAPPVEHRYSTKELQDTLSELESLVYGSSFSPSPRPPSSRPPPPALSTSCVDCDRRFPDGRPPARCPGCGRGLCESCEASSREEDGQLRCVECRARDS